jgi:hypothetical protein
MSIQDDEIRLACLGDGEGAAGEGVSYVGDLMTVAENIDLGKHSSIILFDTIVVLADTHRTLIFY